MAKNTVRVLIPRNPTDLLALGAKIYKKHQDDGSDSPLAGLEDNNWTDHGAKIAQAQAIETQAQQLVKDAENLYKQRDLLIVPIDATIKSSRDLLLGKFAKNPKRLADWSYTVDDTPKAKKPVKA